LICYYGIYLLAVAIGEIPGLAVDRTGLALLGAIAMVAFGVLNTEEAVHAIDFRTILLLFGLMVVSTQFRLGGFYTHTALRLTRWMDRPGAFLLWCLPPTLVALASAYGLLRWMFRNRWAGGPPQSGLLADWPTYDGHQTRKAWLVTLALLALFFTPIPRELTALVAAAVLLCSRRLTTRALLGWVDWHLITLFCGLFVVIRGLEQTGLPGQMVEWLSGRGQSLADPFTLTGVSVVLSNLVSNVPATMLLIKFIPLSDPVPWCSPKSVGGIPLASSFSL